VNLLNSNRTNKFTDNSARIALMKIRHTALLVMICLLCQQAGAVLFTVPWGVSQDVDAPTVPLSSSELHTTCHDASAGNPMPVSTKSNNTHVHGSADPVTPPNTNAQPCGEFQCQCCVGSCVSVLSTQVDYAALAVVSFPNDDYSAFIPQRPAGSLFRPPIIA
jgi:hypothetical protein